MMEITDLRIEKFNKVADLSSLSSSEVLSQLTVVQKFDYAKNVHSFYGFHNQGHHNQVYITQLSPRNFLNRIVYLKLCPMILFLKGEPESIIIEQGISKRLSDYLIQHEETNMVPCLSQFQASKIIAGLTRSASNYRECKLQYDCISPKNVVQNCNSEWQLSVVGLTLGVDKDHPAYSRKQIGEEYRLSLGLGCILFQLIFGFSPLPPPEMKWQGFYIDKYLKVIQQMPSQKLLKIYHYTERQSLISPQCLDLLRRSLSGQLPWSAWCQHQYFNQQRQHKEQILSANHEIVMINSAKQKDVALIMSAIDFKKNNPLERLYAKQSYVQSLSPLQFIDFMQKNNLLKEIRIADKFYKTSKSQKINEKQKSLIVSTEYFHSGGFDREQDSPCRDLIKLIQQEKLKHPNKFSQGEYEARLKLYGFPYAVAFQLLKVEEGQKMSIKKRIKSCYDLLMQLSAMNEIATIEKLHNTVSQYRSYEELKPILRENINQLYQYFLNEAMRNYNLRGDIELTEQKAKKKTWGLQYYRLCLKLLEASLLMRKGGHDLNLNRIETSQRKQIENDLSELLAKYFPKKV